MCADALVRCAMHSPAAAIAAFSLMPPMVSLIDLFSLLLRHDYFLRRRHAARFTISISLFLLRRCFASTSLSDARDFSSAIFAYMPLLLRCCHIYYHYAYFTHFFISSHFACRLLLFTSPRLCHAARRHVYYAFDCCCHATFRCCRCRLSLLATMIDISLPYRC